MTSKHDECFKGCFSLRVSTCLFIFTLCGRIIGALNEPVKVVVMEEDDVILPCSLSTKENIESKLFDWNKDGRKEVFLYDAGLHYNNGRSGQDEQFKGRVSHFPDQLKHGNASIIIRNTTVADSGNYTCIFPLLQPSQTFHKKLVVGGAAVKPSVSIIDQTNDWSLLQCEVLGAFPKPKVEWKDSSGNIVPAKKSQVTKRGDKYDVILNATVTKTDNFSCVATQEEIHHQIDSKIFVHINEKSSQVSGDSTGWIAAVSVLGILLVAAVVIIVLLRKRLREKVVGNVLFSKGIIEVDHIKSRRRHEKGSGNPPGSDHELENGGRTEHLLSGSDVPAQQTSPVRHLDIRCCCF